ncbi:hypothetical protein ACE01N_05315 [Saccharicrinis sp. FJH2]|uniref:hypothetical protein n=1 Tax=Saccharicrinis sp. FJH65 TaxID=3344659 RepID=UPI0035F4A1C3
MKNLIYFLLLIFGGVLVASCEKQEDPVVSFGEYSDIVVNGEGEFSSSINYQGVEVPFTQYYDDTQVQLKSVKVSIENFLLESTVNSPVINGEMLSASYVKVFKVNSEVKAYVTYNLSGSAHGGALVVLDLTDSENPSIVNEILFNDIDINVCEVYHAGKLMWLGGSSFKKGAVIIPVELDNKGNVVADSGSELTLDIITLKNVASVNGIKEAGDWLMVTAGNSGGGTFALNFKKGYRDDGTDYFSNAKFSATNGYTMGKFHVSLEGGKEAKLHVYRIGVNDTENETVVSLGALYHNVDNEADMYSGKATCFMENDSRYCYVSMGASGFVAVDIFEQMVVLQSSPKLLKHGNTNGISVDDQYIYLANGADGLVVCKKPTITYGEDPVIVEPLYVWDEDIEDASANYVTVQDEYIFVAKGTQGGLKIIKRLFE